MAASSQENIDINVLEKCRISSRHFVDEPADLWDKHNVDWLLMQNLGHSKRKQLSEGNLARYGREKRKRDDQRQAEEMTIYYNSKWNQFF